MQLSCFFFLHDLSFSTFSCLSLSLPPCAWLTAELSIRTMYCTAFHFSKLAMSVVASCTHSLGSVDANSHPYTTHQRNNFEEIKNNNKVGYRKRNAYLIHMWPPPIHRDRSQTKLKMVSEQPLRIPLYAVSVCLSMVTLPQKLSLSVDPSSRVNNLI